MVMKKKIIFFALMLFSFVAVEAQSILYAYPIFKKRFENTLYTYCINNGGGCNGNPNYQGAALSTGNLGGNILRLSGIQTKVSRCTAQTVTAVSAFYRIYPTSGSPTGTFTQISLVKGTTAANACGGTDENWAISYSNEGTSLTTNLGIGNYTMEMYFSTTGSGGTLLLNNTGAYYKANFSIVEETTWNGTSWNFGTPAATSDATFAGNYTIASNGFSVKNLRVNSGVTLSVQAERSLKVNGNVTNNGTIIVNNDATYLLVDGSTRSGTGNVIVRRESNLKKDDYNYWSSPVSGQNLYGFSVGTPTNRFYKYSETTDTFSAAGLSAASTFDAGIGYAIKGKNAYSPVSPVEEIFSFDGTDHNGNITVTLAKSVGADKGYNLIGNPYPSNMSFSALYNAGTNKNSIFNKQWFWTNLNDVVTQQGSNYEGNNYATYVSGVGGVGPSFVSGNIEEPSLRPLGFTKVAQGFIVQARFNNAPLTFTNASRSSNIADSIFFNKSQDDEGDGDEGDGEEPQTTIDRYWLKFINPNNIANTILIAHVPYATNGYDEDYDADMFSVGNDAFFSIVNPYKLQIQARNFPIANSDIIGLGYVSSASGNAVIALDDKEGVFKDNLKAIYLKDNQTGIVTNLQNNYYSFVTATGTNESRFSILYENNVLSAQDSQTKEILVYKNNDDLVVKANAVITGTDLFDVSGKLIRTVSGKNSKEIKIKTLGLTKGVYIVKITTEKGITTRKIIL